MTDEPTVAIYDLADDLNVRPKLVIDLIRAGHLKVIGNRVTKESADELRWQLAMHRGVLTDTSAE